MFNKYLNLFQRCVSFTFNFLIFQSEVSRTITAIPRNPHFLTNATLSLSRWASRDVLRRLYLFRTPSTFRKIGYETTLGNGRHADDLEWTEMSAGRASEIRNMYVRTKGRFACIGLLSSSLLGYCISTSFRAFIIPSAHQHRHRCENQLNKCLKLRREDKEKYFNSQNGQEYREILREFPQEKERKGKLFMEIERKSII